jgi:hypothetical protein
VAQEKSVREKVDDIRARCEALARALAEESYEVGAGLKSESNVSAIYRRHGEAVARPAIELVRGRLAAAREAEAAARAASAAPPASPGAPVPGEGAGEPSAPMSSAAPSPLPAAPPLSSSVLIVPPFISAPAGPPGAAPLLFAAESVDADEARRLRALLEFQVEEFVGMEVRAITDEALTRESAARIKVAAAAAAGAGGGGHEEIAFRQAIAEISNSPDRARRQALEDASAAVIDEMTPLLAERIGIERGIARSFGHGTFAALFESVSGIDLRALDALLQGFLARTDDMYREAMGWVVRKRLGIALEDARRHDLHFIFRGAEWDDTFPKSEMLRVAERFLGEMGVDVRAGGNVLFDLEPRERKSARAFCAPVEVPGRVMLCVAPMGGRRDWQHLLHELGKALLHAHTAAHEPFEHRRLGDASVSESYAFLLQYLLVDAAWLKRYLGVGKPKGYLFLAHLEKLAYLRRYAAKLHYELSLHDGENGVEGKDALYEEQMRRALRVRYPRELFLYDVDRSFFVARYLRAWLFEALLSKHLVHYFDEDWFRNPRTGEFLKRHWALGQRLSVEETAREIGYAALDTAALEQEMLRVL